MFKFNINKYICSLLIIGFITSSCTPKNDPPQSIPPAPRQDEPAIESISPYDDSCENFISVIDQSKYSYGWVESPENPLASNSPKLKIFYIKPLKMTDNVIAFYNGGPGSSVHSSFALLETYLIHKGLQDKISFIYIDQRGNGCSSGYPVEKFQNSPEATIRRLTWYGSTGIVYDSEAVRKKILGDQPWKVFGQSYGAYIVHRYISLFPQSLKAAYAHANAISDDSLDRFTYRIESQIRMSEEYFKTHPDDKLPYVTLKRFLSANKDYCVETAVYKQKYCGLEIAEYLNYSLGFKDSWSYLNFLLSKWVQNGIVIHEEILNELNANGDEPQDSRAIAFAVIGYFDRNIAGGSKDNCLAVLNRLKAQNVFEADTSIHECLGSVQYSYTNESREQVAAVLGYQQDLMSYTKLKENLKLMPLRSFYLYSGALDTFVPPKTFDKELSFISDLINYTHFTNSGHEGFYSEDQVWQDLVK